MSNTSYINFLEFQDTKLDAGEYTLSLEQNLEVEGHQKINASLNRTFIVQGDRFKLDPADIHTVFPPAGSQSDCSATLPHIVLNRSTFPWERSLDGIPWDSGPNYPWLGLLVFHDDPESNASVPNSYTITLEDLWNAGQADEVFVPGISDSNSQSLREWLEYGEKKGDPVNVIDVDQNLLSEIMAKRNDLLYLAHVRREMSYDGNWETGTLSEKGKEEAIIVANRLPKAGCRNVVHLVSLRNAFEEEGEFNYGTDPAKPIRLVSLKSWSFFCEKEQPRNFADILKDVDCGPLRLTPRGSDSWIEDYFKAGFTALPHLMRSGEKTISLFRGPLLPNDQTSPEYKTGFELPVESADRLLLFDQQSGLLDVSYAAAWTLGRQLALEDRTFALQLYKHKKQASIAHRKEVQGGEIDYLPLGNNTSVIQESDASIQEREAEIKAWLHKHRLLNTLPFYYLIPSTPKKQQDDAEALTNFLPPGSIRFFKVDPFWLECLQDGALSLGEVPKTTPTRHITPDTIEQISGFLLHSEVVTGYPDIQVLGYTSDLNDTSAHTDDGIAPTVQRKLSDKVMLCLFEGSEIKTADLFLRPKALHFGLKKVTDGDNDVVYEKDLKDVNGEEITSLDDNNNPVSFTTAAEYWHGERDNRVMNIEELANAIQTALIDPNTPISDDSKAEFATFTSADFALEMTEGVPRVRYSVIG